MRTPPNITAPSACTSPGADAAPSSATPAAGVQTERAVKLVYISLRNNRHTPRMVAAKAKRMWRGLVSASEIDAVVSDFAFMRTRNGEIPTRVAEAIGLEAIARRAHMVPL